VMCAALGWLLPRGSFQGFIAASPLNPKLMCMALQLQLFLGMLSPCVCGLLYSFKCLVLGLNIFTLFQELARLRGCLKMIRFLCLFLACPFSSRFSRSAGSQQMFAEMDFRSCLYCHYSAFV